METSKPEALCSFNPKIGGIRDYLEIPEKPRELLSTNDSLGEVLKS